MDTQIDQSIYDSVHTRDIEKVDSQGERQRKDETELIGKKDDSKPRYWVKERLRVQNRDTKDGGRVSVEFFLLGRRWLGAKLAEIVTPEFDPWSYKSDTSKPKGRVEHTFPSPIVGITNTMPFHSLLGYRRW